MELGEAVRILNDRRHRGCDGWYVDGDGSGEQHVRGEDEYDCFEPFEAVAIAEKYAGKSEPTAVHGLGWSINGGGANYPTLSDVQYNSPLVVPGESPSLTWRLADTLPVDARPTTVQPEKKVGD
jgi:hypothetical protein